MEESKKERIVRLILNNNFCYKGSVIEENNDFIVIRDRFGKKVTISKNNIMIMEEVTEC